MAIVTRMQDIIAHADSIIEDDINTILRQIVGDMESEIKVKLPLILGRSSIYAEITTEGTDLNTQIGIPAAEAQAKFKGVFEILSKPFVSFEECRVRNGVISGGILMVGIVAADFLDVIKSDFAKYITPPNKKRNRESYELSWFEWITTSEKYDGIMVLDYVIKFTDGNGRLAAYSRTGNAIMLPKDDGMWTLPPEYAGTTNNNWITQVLEVEAGNVIRFLNDVVAKYMDMR